MTDLTELVAKLKAENLTLIAAKGSTQIVSEEKGIARVLRLLEESTDFLEGADVADKIVGKAAAMLFIKAKVGRLYALTLSEQAQRCLAEHGICVRYERLVPYIQNRAGTDICPMEKAVMALSDPEAAFRALSAAVVAMKNSGVQG